jgi:hypothetical protein
MVKVGLEGGGGRPVSAVVPGGGPFPGLGGVQQGRRLQTGRTTPQGQPGGGAAGWAQPTATARGTAAQQGRPPGRSCPGA